MSRPLRIAMVGPVARPVPPGKAGSVELVTSVLTEGLVSLGHEVTLFATGDSRTTARLAPTFARGYTEDPDLWMWEVCDLVNLAAAVERAAEFDVIHYQCQYQPLSLAFTRLVRTPIVQTIHYTPRPEEVRLWSRYPEAPFIAISREQAQRMAGLNVAGVILHGIAFERFDFQPVPDDYLVFLGRSTRGKGVVQAIDIAQAAGMRLLVASPEDDDFRARVAPRVDGRSVVYVGEVDHRGKVSLLGGARALVYPVQEAEPFGLVMVEAMACGTPVAALDRGAVREVLDDGRTGYAFAAEADLVAGLGRVTALDRRVVRETARARLGAQRMVDEHVAVYRRLADERQRKG